MISAWQKDIQKDYDDRKASVVWALTDGNDIEKGIASDLSYSDSELKYVNKKGSEIKGKLNEEKSRVAFKLAESNIKLGILKSSIGTESAGNKEGDLVRYSYEQMYPSNQTTQSSEYESPKEGQPSPQKDKMREYNNNVRSFNHCKRELKTLDLVIGNVNDKKDYKLPLRVAEQLGF